MLGSFYPFSAHRTDTDFKLKENFLFVRIDSDFLKSKASESHCHRELYQENNFKSVSIHKDFFVTLNKILHNLSQM